MSRVLIAGCGWLGTALGLRLAARGDEVFGLRRNVEALPQPIVRVQADLAAAGLAGLLPNGVSRLVLAASPDASDEEGYRAAYVEGPRRLLETLGGGSALERIVFVGSTSVYPQDDGSWVDEDSPVGGTGFRSRTLLEGEALIRSAGGRVLRLPGLYGPGRERLVALVRAGRASFRAGGANRARVPEWTNRIHRDDAVEALLCVLDQGDAPATLIACDDEPVPRAELLRWLAKRCGAPAPQAEAEPSAGRRGKRPRTSKRLSNARLKSLGWSPRFPSYREGYAQLAAEAARE